jgi:hypothetical protein
MKKIAMITTIAVNISDNGVLTPDRDLTALRENDPNI